MIQAGSGKGFRHLLQYVDTAYISGQIGMAEPSEKMLIGRSKSEMSEHSGTDWNWNTVSHHVPWELSSFFIW
jgi:hypothetical protein